MRELLRAAEIDARMAGMVLALGIIWLGLDAATGGIFLSARNLYNLAVQSSAVGIMAMGMVLVIVSRHIDLSVGSVLGFTGMTVAALQAEAGWAWPLCVGAGLLLGAAIGTWQGYWVAFRGVPAFVVTLAGLLIFRGAAWLVTDGRTVAPLDASFQRLGGGLEGSIGTTWNRRSRSSRPTTRWRPRARTCETSPLNSHAAAHAFSSAKKRWRSRRRRHPRPMPSGGWWTVSAKAQRCGWKRP